MAIKWTYEQGAFQAGTLREYVISINFSMGRQNPLDDYAGNTCNVVVRNFSGIADSVGIGSVAYIYPIDNSYNPIGAVRKFWLQAITYDDQIDLDASTATLTYIDGYGRLGQTPLTDKSSPPYASTTTIVQSDAYITQAIANGIPYGYTLGINTFNKTSGAPVPNYSAGSSTVPSLGTSGTESINTNASLLEYLNLNARSENTSFDVPTFIFSGVDYTCIYITDRKKMAAETMTVGVGAVKNSTTLLWDQLSRDKYGTNFYNQVAVNWEIGANTLSAVSNTSSGTAITRLDVTSREYDALNGNIQGANHAQWLSSSYGQLTSYFQISFIDVIQNDTALQTFIGYDALVNKFLPITYNTPSGLVTTKMKIEGVDVEIINGLTRFTLYLSSLSLYSFFTLNDTTLGVLDSDRLAW